MKTLPIHLDSRHRNGRAVDFGLLKTKPTQGGGMACPNCGARKTQTVDSRPVPNGTYRRRRVCICCQFRFTTYELYRPDFIPDYVI